MDERFSEEAIDGSTLEKRREQRKVQLEEFIGSFKPEDRREVIGKVNQWTKATGVGVVDASHSVYDLDSPAKRLRSYAEPHTFEVPPIRKRTPDERVSAFVRRMLSAPPGQMEALLSEVAGEYWKAGMPVTVDALRAVASKYLNMHERRKA